MNTTVVSLISMGSLAGLFAFGLAIASKKFAVETDPKIEEIEEVLPGVNCGACGFAGCRSFAEGVASGKAPANGCPVGGARVAKLVAEIIGVEAEGPKRKVAQVLCKGGLAEAKQRGTYDGPRDCHIANATQGGDKLCTYGCLGYGTCVAACKFDAMYMGDNGLPVVIEENCTGCNKCVEACPRDIITLVDEEQGVHIRCRSLLTGRFVRQQCEVGCIACRRCVKACPTGAIYMEDNLARIDYDKCTNCRECVEVCPMNTIDWQEGKPLVLHKEFAS
ncbi:MAG: RnfABCDGE type electron transport complex subunit B [Firmicutes bacterium]|nr:RnfABCDGE type electron transport complex subunit B [Bacillota bacterium]NLO65566.1 RnfABCDGE type electron transport complex subunit B [Bacillota bacterium]